MTERSPLAIDIVLFHKLYTIALAI